MKRVGSFLLGLLLAAGTYAADVTNGVTPGAAGGGTDASLLTQGTVNCARLPAFTSAITTNGCVATLATVGVTAGGTGLTTATLGDLVYGSGSNTRAILAGNTTATLKVLTETGTGSVSAPPVWTDPGSLGEKTVAQWGVPVIVVSNGTMGNNGAMSGVAAMAVGNGTKAYVCIPAGAVATSTPASAGCYFATFSSTTAATVCNNLLSGIPAVVTCTPFVTTGPGSFTQQITAYTVSFTIPANSVNATGGLRYLLRGTEANNTDTRSVTVSLGGTQIATLNSVSQSWWTLDRTLMQQGTLTNELGFNATNGNNPSDRTQATAAAAPFTIDLGANETFSMALVIGTATDFYMLAGGLITATNGS